MKKSAQGHPVIYEVMWSDDYVVVEGTNPEFGHSLHKTKKGAETEAKRMRHIARHPNARRGGKVTSRYRITQRVLLP